MSSDGNFALNDFGETSHIQIHVAGDYYSGAISNSAVGGRGNSVSIQNIASKNIDIREELHRVANWLTNQNFQDDTVDEQSRFKEWTKFREWLEKDEATLSSEREVPGTLSVSEMPRVERAIKALEDDLISSAPSVESRIFNLKMLGDCYRYQAQFAKSDRREERAFKAWKVYMEASEITVAALTPLHPIRLGLAMSLSLFYYEILNSPGRACHLAHQAWTDAFAEIDNTSEDFKDSITMLIRLRDSLTLWATEMADAERDDTELDDSEV